MGANRETYDVLCRRIAALDRDISLELDREKRVTLEERRSEAVAERDAIGARLMLSNWQDEDMTPLAQMDGRALTESTLRGLDGKMDRLMEQVHDIDTRQRILELQVTELKTQMTEVRNQLTRVDIGEEIPRIWLIGGGISVVIALILLMLISWRIL